MFNKKKLRELEEKLFNANTSVSGLKYNLGVTKGDLIKVTTERDDWRAKYELLYHTPEVKADIESAFSRGHNHAVGQFKAWLFDAATTLPFVEDKTND
jgi:hypothetical protein